MNNSPSNLSRFCRVTCRLVGPLALAAGLACATRFAIAEEPEFSPDRSSSAAARDQTSMPQNQCVLLRNGNVLFGTAREVGELVIVTRHDESVIQLMRRQVEALGKSVEELYEHRVKDRLPHDLREIQSDVRWCLRQGLVRQAAADVLRARKLDRHDPQTIQLVRLVARALEREAEKTNDPPNSAGPIQQVSHQVEWFDQQTTVAERQPDSEALDQPIELDDSTRNQFATRVQPILMNRCSGCHAREKREHQFQLHSSLTSRWAPKRVVEDNLRAVMPYLDLDQPMSSELRRRALDNHGGRQNSFGDEQSAMTAHLDMWLQSLRGGKSRAFSASKKKSLGRGPAPHTPRIAETLEPSPPPRLNPFGERLSQPDGADAAWSEVSLRENAARTKPTARSSDRGTPRRMPPVRNPFDPEIFNRQFQNR